MLARALAVLAFAALAATPDAHAQTGQQLYTTHCLTCHGPAVNNQDGVLGGKDWNIILGAMNAVPDMIEAVLPLYPGIIDNGDLMAIASYLQTFAGGATASLVMPAAINFGNQAVGVGSAVQVRNITITGNAAVQLSSTVSSSNPLEFSIVSTTCTAGAFVLPPTGNCSVSIQFTPVAAGARSGQINVLSNGIGSPQSFAVSGTGGAGPPPAGALTVPASANLGSQQVGVQTAGTNITISNASAASVTVASVQSSSPTEFPVTGNSCTGTVPAGGSCTVTVAFKPAANGARNGVVTITSSGTGSPQGIAVSGTGTTTPPPPPSGLSVPSSLNFGSQTVNVQSAGSNISVSNPGASAVSISSIVSSSVSEFPIVGNTCGVVPAGGNCTITLAFRPPFAGARSGSLTIGSNGTGSPNVVALSGTGLGTAPTPNKVLVVEYYNAAFGHYFMTADTDEITGLDGGAYNFAFVRTGRQFNAWSAATAGTVPVCRFFTTPGTFGPKSSHFYTANTAECNGLKFNPNWQYEKIAFHVAVPTGACPGGTSSIYRMYNSGQTGAPNHRFTSDFSVYQDFTTTKNWAPEGTSFCAPP